MLEPDDALGVGIVLRRFGVVVAANDLEDLVV
jgi:hypothetical protein